MGRGNFSFLWAIIEAKNLVGRSFRLSRGWRVISGSDGASPSYGVCQASGKRVSCFSSFRATKLPNFWD